MYCASFHLLLSSQFRRHTIFTFFFFNDTATTEIYTLSLHDALPICIEDERLALSIEGSSKGFPDATFAVGIHDIHHVKVARRHDVANLPVGREHLSLSIYATLQIRKLCFPIRSFDLQAGDCCLVGMNCC